MDLHDPTTDQPTPGTRRTRRTAVAGACVAAVAAAVFAIPAFAAGGDAGSAAKAQPDAAPAAPARATVVMFNAAGERVSNEVDATVIIGCAVADPSIDPAELAGVPVEASAADPGIPSFVMDIDLEGVLDC